MTPKNDRQTRILKGFATLASGTMLSRATGMIREMVLAFFLGASSAMDAYVIAFTLPNLFRRILGEKVLESAVLPTYKKLKNNDCDAEAADLMKTSLMIIVAIGTLVTGCGMVFTPYLVSAFAPGFNPETHLLAVVMSRIMFPFLVLISVASMCGVILQTREKFGLYALAPALFNLSIIGFLLFGIRIIGPVSAAWGVLAGGFLEILVMYPVVRQTFHFRQAHIRLKDPSVRKVNNLALPVLIETILDKTIVLVDRRLASIVSAGSIAALGYAFRLLQLPYGILVLAIARTFYQHMVDAAEDVEEFIRMVTSALRFTLALMLPCTGILIVFCDVIVRIVYQRGAFDETSVNLTSSAFACYGVGMVGMTLLAILTRAFNALQDTRTPVKVSVAMMCINIVMNYVLVKSTLGHAGLALASSIAYSFAGIALLVLLHQKLKTANPNTIVRFKIGVFSCKVTFAVLLASGLMWWLKTTIQIAPTLHGSLITLLIGAVGFSLVYLTALHLLGLPVKKLLTVD